MSVSTEIEKRVLLLQSGDPHVRDVAASEIADLLEADGLDQATIPAVMRTLTQFALAESDATVKESLFNALATAAEIAPGADVDWEPIASHLDKLPLDGLEHALGILGSSGCTRYKESIRRFRLHPDEDIRSAAVDALALLKQTNPPQRTGKISPTRPAVQRKRAL